jgi:hypothetical protein
VSFAVYTGESLASLIRVKPPATNVTFFARGGTTYFVAAVASAAATGDFRFDFYTAGFSSTSYPVPGNLLCEGSMENTRLEFTCWGVNRPIGGCVNELGGADGMTWATLIVGSQIWQDFATVPGRTYEVKFAYRGTPLRVKWNEDLLGHAITDAENGAYWRWTNFNATAVSNTTRLLFESLEGWVDLDAASVVWRSEPPSIVTQPATVTTFEGASASFVVGARGTGPLAYQWFFDGAAMPGKTSHALQIDNALLGHAGQYHAVVTNLYGAVTSSPATLAIEQSPGPVIVLQPYGEAVPLGGYFALSVAANGAQPLQYQWHLGGAPLSGATNRHLIFSPFAATNAGTYTVEVWNQAGTAWSLPAVLSVGEANQGGGVVLLANHFQIGVVPYEMPVFDVDGSTPLNGSNYVTQLYAGLTLAALRPAGDPIAGFGGGFFASTAVTLPTVPPGSNAVVQVRVWDGHKGASYEEARALGSRFGRSHILNTVAGGGGFPTEYLYDLTSFSLQAGLPQFVAGRINLASLSPDGTATWTLVGEAGFRYVIEKASTGMIWRPFLVLTNQTGSATFTDPQPASPSFYRARILE